MKKIIQILGCLSAVALLAPAASITSTNTGAFMQTNLVTDLSPANGRFAAGQAGLATFVNYSVFDLSGQSGTVTGATLTVFQGPSGSFNPTGPWNSTYSLWDVNTAISSLIAGGNVAGAFSDLGGGTAFGSVAYSSTDASFTVSLNSSALAAIQARIGVGSIAFGGSLGGGGYAFDYVPSGASLPTLNLTFDQGGGNQGGGNQGGGPPPVPEPGTIVLMGSALVGLGLLRRRQ